jgi:opacity protein-like surface antigen
MDKFSFFATAGVGYSMGRKIKFNYTEEVTVVGEPKAYSQLVNVPAADWNKFLNSYSSICKTLITTNEDVTITGIQNPKGSTAAGGTATCIGTSKATTTEDVKKVKEVNFNSVVYNVGLGAKYEVVSNIDLMLTVGYTGYTQASQTVDKTKFTLMGGFVATQISVGYRF